MAAETYLWFWGPQEARSAKLRHQHNKRCIFRCNHTVIVAHDLEESIEF